MTKMRSRFLFALVVLICCLSGVEASPQAKKVTEWKTAPEMLSKLSPPVQTEFGTIRIPSGYILEKDEFEGSSAYTWGKQARKQGVDQAIGLVSPALTPQQFRDYTLKTALDDLVVGYQRAFADWKQTAPQSGRVNGTQALRLHWSGTTRNRGVKVEGSLFMVQLKDRFLLMVTTVRANDQVGMKLTEAAALTFKPK